MSDARHRSGNNGGLGDGLRRGEKIAIAGGGWRFGEPPPDAQAVPPEAHESLGSRKTVAEVPLTGLSFPYFHRSMSPTHVLEYESDLPPLAMAPVSAFAMHRRSADGSRPELTRHEFAGSAAGSGRAVLALFPGARRAD